MDKYRKEIRELETKIHDGMGDYSQIVIDFIQNVLEEVFTLTYDQGEPVFRDTIGSYCYDIGILLEVFNPVLEKDISVLKELEEILRRMMKEIEFINNALGIPKHKG